MKMPADINRPGGPGNELYTMEEEVLEIVRDSGRCGLNSSVEEIRSRLAPQNAVAENAFADAVDALKRKGRILVEKGEIALRQQSVVTGDAIDRRKRAEDYMSFGTAFLENVLPSVPGVIMAGICGSVSYGSALPGDDVDIVLVCRNGSLWTAMKKVLLAARALRKRDAARPVICLSYCADDSAFREEAGSHRTRLYASDFLNIRVVAGRAYYQNVLASSGWMRSCYPHTYAARAAEAGGSEAQVGQQSTVHDRLDYLLVGNYLNVMAGMRNIIFRLRGKGDRAFTARIERDRCVYASDRWGRLEKG